ncbi:hypothetical protein QO002_004225 [Pararhizobium capsulatum DSM 1112]|uniref:NADP-dependent oxidoreductase domain-containing protein n=1 Tax=Pararhizobium capsulatum DSM 1112 TaxID=1121113 RepID=A0ABU0BUT9_9HYPH|nr:hypothetical protein [Pararhizobium capsulatum DSM 1112]
MAHAYDNGINFFDNAEGYESGNSEIVMGQALKTLGWSRDSFVVSSKVFWGGEKPTQRGLSREHVTEAAHAALKRLRLRARANWKATSLRWITKVNSHQKFWQASMRSLETSRRCRNGFELGRSALVWAFLPSMAWMQDPSSNSRYPWSTTPPASIPSAMTVARAKAQPVMPTTGALLLTPWPTSV